MVRLLGIDRGATSVSEIGGPLLLEGVRKVMLFLVRVSRFALIIVIE
jgi:hypothetical protein